MKIPQWAVFVTAATAFVSHLRAQSNATITVDCASAQGALYRQESYNNVGLYNTDTSTRQADFSFLNAQGVHPKVLRVWLKEAEVYDPTTGTYNFSVWDPYLTDVSSFADTLLGNINGSAMISSWGYTPAQCKPIIKNILQYVKANYPKLVYVEAMNEPDLYSPAISSSALYGYYQVFYQAVNELNAQYNYTVPLQVGGPAISSFKYSSSWLTTFLDGYAADTAPDKRLAFLSFHAYSYKSDPIAVNSIRSTVDSWLAARNLPTTLPTWITEMGLYPGSGSDTTVADDQLRQAAGMMAYTYWYTNSAKNVPFEWVVRHPNNQYRKDQLMVNYTNIFTPYGNTLKMLSLMKANRVSATSDTLDANGLGIYGLAATDATGVSIIAANYQWTNTNRYNVTLAVDNLPAIFAGYNIRQQVYKIDQTTSNSYYDLNAANLTLVSDVQYPNPGSSYTTTLTTANENSLQLVVLSPGAASTPPPVTVTPTADAYVRDGHYANTNYGTTTVLMVKHDATGYNRKAYLTFDPSSAASVTTATLKLYVASVNSSASRTISVYAEPTSTWGETSITWNNGPAAGSLLGSFVVSNTAGISYNFDVSSYVQAQRAAGIKQVSFVLINNGAADSKGDVSFASREASTGKPTLTIQP